jgi:hypothetical protein
LCAPLDLRIGRLVDWWIVGLVDWWIGGLIQESINPTIQLSKPQTGRHLKFMVGSPT